MGPLELLYDCFEDHVKAAKLIDERRPLAFGVFCFALGGVGLFVAQALAERLVLLPFSWYSCLLAVLWELAVGFLLTAVLHLILEMGGVRGSAAGLFVLLGVSELAWTLAVPLLLLARAAGPGSPWAATGIFLLVGLLSFSLKARGIKDNYGVSLGRAWVTLSLPYLAVAGAAVLAFSVALAGLFMELVKAVR